MTSKRDIVISTSGAVLTVVLVAGCCGQAWTKFPMSVRPDRSCRTGSASGYDVHIWECLDHSHVVIYQYNAEMSCSEPQKEVVPCGGLTPIEERLGADVAVGCEPPPDAYRWP